MDIAILRLEYTRDQNWRYYLQIQIPWRDNNTEAFLMKLSIGTDRWDGWQAAKRFKYARTLFQVTQLRLAQPSNSDQGGKSFHGKGAGLSTYKVLGQLGLTILNMGLFTHQNLGRGNVTHMTRLMYWESRGKNWTSKPSVLKSPEWTQHMYFMYVSFHLKNLSQMTTIQ